MVNIQIPKDVREFQPKFLGPFTFRQALALVAAGAIQVAGYMFQTRVLHLKEPNYIPQLIIAIIPMFFGWGEEAFRMKPEIFLRRVFRNMLVVPRKRPYKTRNFYDIYYTEENEEASANSGKKHVKKKKKRQEDIPPEFMAFD